ncbi:hypothetical protein C8A01DRAFT_15230 [Parachaetomium inaequale]|uniref:Rhodopsin domain-containing protein n=1 Tax=Parachaetomium inaequale TaxID=2588326 RepID=A0AAN6SSS0_9PEZI|nr:hypothetical protein C8A01DRAFT_15230 [Parachaetomium inaequale]
MRNGSETANTANNAESRASRVVLACALAPPFALLFVALRFYTARNILRTIHIDDCKCNPVGRTLVNVGMGQQREYLRAQGVSDLRPFMIIAIIPTSMTGNLASLFTKTSILRFYLRFSTSRRFNIAVYVIMAVIVIASFLGAFGFVFGCQPIHYQWDYVRMKGQGKCLAMDPWYGWLVAFNCVADAVLLVLPTWIIGPLRVGFAQKAAVATILGTGGFVLAVSILRFVMVAQGWGDPDLTYKFATHYIWSIIEINVGIVCACAPCLRALVGRYIPSLLQLGQGDGVVDMYAIPVSQVARRLPGPPARGGDRDGGSNTTTSTGGSWRSKIFRSGGSSEGT